MNLAADVKLSNLQGSMQNGCFKMFSGTLASCMTRSVRKSRQESEKASSKREVEVSEEEEEEAELPELRLDKLFPWIS